MAFARGICPACGREIAVLKNGTMREHNGTENHFGYTNYCGGTGQPAASMVKTLEEAAAERKKVNDERKAKKEAEEKAEKDRKAELLRDIPDEAKERLAKAIMDYNEPNICPDGRREFLKEYGFPIPPQRRNIRVEISVEIPDDKIRRGHIKESYLKVLHEALEEVVSIGKVTNVW